MKGAILLTAIKLLIAVKSLVARGDGEQATPPSCMPIGAYKAVL